jgi:hypothetical protein
MSKRERTIRRGCGIRHEAIRAINVEVAGKMGLLPREIRNRAIGRPRPR